MSTIVPSSKKYLAFSFNFGIDTTQYKMGLLLKTSELSNAMHAMLVTETSSDILKYFLNQQFF